VLDRLTQTETTRGRLRICRHVVFPPASAMRTFFPLARHGRGGLALAYCLRPLRLAAQAPPALRDWARALRAVRAQRRSSASVQLTRTMRSRHR
jgi:hypothetical protein